MFFRHLSNLFLQKIVEKTMKNHAQTMKKSSLKSTCFLTSIFLRFGLHFGRFWEPLGPLLAGLGHPKCGPRGCPSLRESSFVSTFVVFVARLSVFFDLGGFGKGFWRFGEGFLSGFREFCDHFNIDFYNFYRFRGATLLSLFFLAILDGWKK